MKNRLTFTKGLYYYSFIFYISFIIGSIYYAFVGIDFGFFGEVDMNYGTDAMVVYAIVKVICLWWFYIAIFIFQIIYTTYNCKHPECKQIKLRDYLKNYIFLLAIALYILIMCLKMFLNVGVIFLP